MKKIINKLKSNLLFTFIISGIIFGSMGIYAASLYYAKDVKYEPTDETWEVSNVSDALNDLYELNQNISDEKFIFDKVLDIGISVGTYDHKKTYTQTYTVNIKDKYPEIYDKLTAENFISNFTNSHVQAEISGDGWVASYVNIDKNYTDGILTITVSFTSTLNLSGNQGCGANIYLSYIS